MLQLQKPIILLFCLLIVGCAGQGNQKNPTPTTDVSPTLTQVPENQEARQSTPEIPEEDSNKADESNTADLTNFVDRAAAFGYSGLTLIAQNGDILHSSSYGLANRTTEIPPTDQTLFDIGSLTKLFTAVAILQLESQGLVSLEEPINAYLDNVPADKANITIHQLLTHSSGLDAHHSFSDFDPMTKEEAWEEIQAQELLFPPGEFSEYSNSGYTILALIIENVSGQPYQTYLRENLFEPASMVRSGFYGDSRWTETDVAQAYIGEEAFGSPLTWDGPYWGLIGNGGIVSTLSDLYQWHLALQNNTILDDNAKTKLWEPWIPLDEEGVVNEGYGWIIVNLPDQGRVGLLSGGDGYDAMNAHYRHYRDNDLTVITLSNDGRFPGEILARSLANFTLGQIEDLPPTISSISPNLLSLYEGTYQLPSGDQFIIENNGNNLLIGARGQDAINLLSSNVPESDERLITRSLDILNGFSEGDFNPVFQAYQEDIPLADLEDFFGTMWSETEAENGSFQQFQPLGTEFNELGDLTTLIEAQFSRGAVIFRLYWFDEALEGLENDASLPGMTQFWSQSDTVFVAYDFFSSQSISVHFNIENGRIISLTLTTPNNEEITASKIEE